MFYTKMSTVRRQPAPALRGRRSSKASVLGAYDLQQLERRLCSWDTAGIRCPLVGMSCMASRGAYQGASCTLRVCLLCLLLVLFCFYFRGAT